MNEGGLRGIRYACQTKPFSFFEIPNLFSVYISVTLTRGAWQYMTYVMTML